MLYFACLESFKKARFYYQEFQRHIPDSTIPTALIGISSETEEILTERGQSFVESKDLGYFEMQKNDIETFEKIIIHLTKKALASKQE